MTPENIDRIRVMYRDYYHQSVDSLPDGWFQIVRDFLYEMDGLGDLTDSVSIRFERTSSGAKAFCFPEMGRWTNAQMTTLGSAQTQLYLMSQQTCEVCGNPGASEDGHVYCIGHAGELAAKARREAGLYDEIHLLFPPGHGSAINLNVPDHLFDLLASTFRAILKVVERYEVVGKVLITRVEMDDGALFVRVRYTDLTYMFIGVQMEVNELISDLEMLSDEATRKHNLGGQNAS
ncbi:hypothetical protein [Rhizobium leguminosarum]|uniref:hypothetical protein n=1 Tax=Rhizobium leguminosarum TaxID=384 RepID=UPI0015FDD62E|nr:hypothetical protein [Rhizobium leguminosarum]MBA9034317.1 hypothetical protein [Rhizobium leguminosarum]